MSYEIIEPANVCDIWFVIFFYILFANFSILFSSPSETRHCAYFLVDNEAVDYS